jgi:hypothetical protein
MWRAIAEDFSIFDVDVTTEEPPELANPQSFSSAVRVVIGGSSSDWFGGAAGGVAWVGSFGQQGWNIAYVFSRTLGNAPKSVWEAASHEGGVGGWSGAFSNLSVFMWLYSLRSGVTWYWIGVDWAATVTWLSIVIH